MTVCYSSSRKRIQLFQGKVPLCVWQTFGTECGLVLFNVFTYTCVLWFRMCMEFQLVSEMIVSKSNFNNI